MQQPVKFTPSEGGNDKVEVSIAGNVIDRIQLNVENRYLFQDLSHLEWSWHIACDISLDPVVSGTFTIPNDANKNSVVVLNIDAAREKIQTYIRMATTAPVEYFLNIRGVLKNDESWAKKGHVLITEQFQVVIETMEPQSTDRAAPALGNILLTVEETHNMVTVLKEGQPLLAIARNTGTIQTMSTPDGTNLLAGQVDVDNAGITPNYTRALTDNDRGGVELLLGFVLPDSLKFINPVLYRLYGIFQSFNDLSYSWFWKVKGLMPDDPPIIKCNSLDVSETTTRVEIKAECSVQQRKGCKELFKQTIVYTVLADGRVKLETKVHPNACIKDIPSLARVGWEAVLDAKLFHMTYYGRGQVENYPDRKAGTEIGIYNTTVDENEVDYIVPSENGNKSDCRWVTFRDGRGRGLLIVSEHASVMNIGASHFTQAELHRALHTMARKTNNNAPIYAHIDHKIMGVAGDVSWFPAVYPEYRIEATRDFEYTVWLVPLSDNDDPLMLAKNI